MAKSFHRGRQGDIDILFTASLVYYDNTHTDVHVPQSILEIH